MPGGFFFYPKITRFILLEKVVTEIENLGKFALFFGNPRKNTLFDFFVIFGIDRRVFLSYNNKVK